jgi:hypothetical protein
MIGLIFARGKGGNNGVGQSDCNADIPVLSVFLSASTTLHSILVCLAGRITHCLSSCSCPTASPANPFYAPPDSSLYVQFFEESRI